VFRGQRRDGGSLAQRTIASFELDCRSPNEQRTPAEEPACFHSESNNGGEQMTHNNTSFKRQERLRYALRKGQLRNSR